jgi:hypothetical protein
LEERDEKSAGPSDVQDSQGFQAFSPSRIERFSETPQGLVNHLSQALVNHANECSASDIQLTSLFKRLPNGLWQSLVHRPGA